ncbi:hypothetical protein [Nocardioides sp. SYSU DS0663]|uniref:hypothetical protein n=1 Tax=Nocardioides sp. SYSU DS0663 TaxID=3416445 RepID=UPI003F4BF472
MASTLGALLGALLPVLAHATAPAYAEEPAAARLAARSLSVTPTVHVAGQAVRFRGNIGRTGRRAVHLQSHMNRPGDRWLDVPGTSFRTDARGDFDFVFPAPSMFKISYRVAAGRLATSSYLFNARPQEITLSLAGRDADLPFHAIAPLLPFTVVADTTPAVRSALGTPPPLPGRTVHLQERVGGSGWRTIDTGVTDAEGHARFRVEAPLLGQRVLRARQERWTRGRSAIGWYPSFPAYFSVLGLPDLGDLLGLDLSREAAARPVAPAPGQRVAARSPLRPTASERHGWGASLFDFAWERGQDLDAPPSKGTRLRGGWRDTSDGTGRAVPFNGGLVLQSKLKHGGVGDLGTTTATLRRNTQVRGRWEFRLQGHVWEGAGRPYRFLLELVPPGAPVTACSPRSIVVADVTMGTPGLGVGVRSQPRGAVWRRTLGDVRLAETPFNMAVEVGRRHVTWFRDGQPVATVKDARAQLGTRLVPRLSLVGERAEMAGAQVDSDWQRAWSLDRGRQVRSGAPLARSSYAC